MTRVRWALLALAVLVGVAAWLLVSGGLHDPPAAAEPAAVAALPLNLPAPSIAGSGPPTAPLSAAAGPAKAAQTTAVAPRIGSEGYGPHIERAQYGADSAAIWESVQWLRSCADNEVRRHSFEQTRNMGVAPEMMTQMMLEADAEGRRCQTVTAQHRALLPELALRAMRAGLPEAASVYAGATKPEALAPALREKVSAAMRRDAQAGRPGSLLGALVAAEAWGLSQTEKLAYMFAYGEMSGAHGHAVVETLVKHHGVLTAPPTPEQLAAAKRAGQQIIDKARAKP